MQQAARQPGHWQHWTGRIVPVLGLALLAVAPAQAKDHKHRHHDDAPAQASAPPDAQVPPRNDAPGLDLREPPRQVREISLDRIIEQIQSRYHANVVRHERSDADGRHVYVLRLLSDQGRVWTVRVDAETGKEL